MLISPDPLGLINHTVLLLVIYTLWEECLTGSEHSQNQKKKKKKTKLEPYQIHESSKQNLRNFWFSCDNYYTVLCKRHIFNFKNCCQCSSVLDFMTALLLLHYWVRTKRFPNMFYKNIWCARECKSVKKEPLHYRGFMFFHLVLFFLSEAGVETPLYKS